MMELFKNGTVSFDISPADILNNIKFHNEKNKEDEKEYEKNISNKRKLVDDNGDEEYNYHDDEEHDVDDDDNEIAYNPKKKINYNLNKRNVEMKMKRVYDEEEEGEKDEREKGERRFVQSRKRLHLETNVNQGGEVEEEEEEGKIHNSSVHNNENFQTKNMKTNSYHPTTTTNTANTTSLKIPKLFSSSTPLSSDLKFADIHQTLDPQLYNRNMENPSSILAIPTLNALVPSVDTNHIEYPQSSNNNNLKNNVPMIHHTFSVSDISPVNTTNKIPADINNNTPQQFPSMSSSCISTDNFNSSNYTTSSFKNDELLENMNLNDLNKTSSSYIFSQLNDNDFEKMYEMLVIQNFVKLYPEMISILKVSISELNAYDDETRKKKYAQCRLYVLIQIESSTMNSFTNLIGLILRVAVHFLFPNSISKAAHLTLSRLLENTEKKASAIFYFHAVSNLKKRNYEAPNIFYGYFTELLKVISTLITEYMALSIEK